MILVSGGTGLVGSHLLVELIKAGKEVRATYKNEGSKLKAEKVFKFHHAYELYKKINWIKADITDYYSLKDAFEGITHVFHTAALVSFDETLRAEIMEVNIEGTKNIVNLCQEFNVSKLCYVSSVAALGKKSNAQCSDEVAEWHSSKNTSTYSISKFQSENEVWRGIAEGLNAVIINPSTILGYGDWNSTSLILIKRVALGLKFFPPGTNGFVGVKDVVKSAILLMESNVASERFVISSQNLSFKALFKMIATEFKKDIPKYEVNQTAVKFLLILDRLFSIFPGVKRKLPASSLNTIFEKRCFSSQKFIEKFSFEFEPIEHVVKDLAPAFQAK